MKCYLINMDRSPDRLERMTAMLSGRGIRFERVQAVDGRQLPPDLIAQHQSGSPKFYRLGPGEIGCFLSHKRCWERIAAGQDEYGVVLEDDLHFGENAELFTASSAWIPSDADLVKLETDFTRTFIDKRPTAVVGTRNVSRLRGGHAGGGAYIVSRSYAGKLIALSEIFVDPVDQFLFHPALQVFPDAVIYQVSPAPYVQDNALPTTRNKQGLVSMLAHERPRQQKRRGLAKVRTELIRPFQRLGHLFRAAATSQLWGAVPFK